MARQILNNNVPMLEQRTKINDNFTELYADSHKHINAELLDVYDGTAGNMAIIADALDYPVGWIQVTGWTDDVVYTNHGVWLKCAGIDTDGWPKLDCYVPTYIKQGAFMTNDISPSPQKTSACSSDVQERLKPWSSHAASYANGWWHSGIAFSGNVATRDVWWQMDFGAKMKVDSMYLLGETANQSRTPSEFIVLGSDDGSDWEELAHYNLGTYTYQLNRYFDFNAVYNYRFYRIKIIKTAQNPANAITTFMQIRFCCRIYATPTIPLQNGLFSYVKAKTSNGGAD